MWSRTGAGKQWKNRRKTDTRTTYIFFAGRTDGRTFFSSSSLLHFSSTTTCMRPPSDYSSIRYKKPSPRWAYALNGHSKSWLYKNIPKLYAERLVLLEINRTNRQRKRSLVHNKERNKAREDKKLTSASQRGANVRQAPTQESDAKQREYQGRKHGGSAGRYVCDVCL